MEGYRLKILNMSRPFLGVKAPGNIKLAVKPRSIRALIGENGASKSTLMKYLFGLYHPNGGTIEVDEQVMDIKNPNDALKSGISMIHQGLNPVPYRSVVDNIWADRFQTKGITVDKNQMMEKTRNLLRDLDFDTDVTAFAKNSSVSQMQVIEIAKAVSYNVKIIIMDEPVSSLAVAETQHLSRIIGKPRREGRSIIYVSRKLEETFEIADEITVTRDDQYISAQDIKDIIIGQLIGQMMERKMDERFPVCGNVRTNKVMLWVENFTSADPCSFKNMSLDLYRREILGIDGLVGTQKTELIETISDLCKIVSGELTVNGETVVNHSPQDVIRNGFALLAEERRTAGIIPMLSVWDNTLTVAYKKLTDNVLGYVYTKKLSPSIDKVCTDLDVRMTGTKTLIKNLSGGDRQKVLIGRWLLTNCNVVILDEPIRGMGVGAKYETYRIIQDLVKEGKAVIMVSPEMSESLGMSDRVMIMCTGKQTGIPDKKEATRIEVMRYTTQFDDKTKERVSV